MFSTMRQILIGSYNDSNRDKWVRKQLKAIPSGIRLMDAGAGECRFADACGHLDYIPQDLGEYDGTGDGKSLQMGKWDISKIKLKCDITNVPEPDESFGAILATELLEHVPDPVSALREMVRLLKPGGTLLVTAPFCSVTHFSPQYYSTGLSRHWYEYHLSKLDMDIDELEISGDFYESLAQEIHRLPQVAREYDAKELNFIERHAIQFVFKALARLQNKQSNTRELLSHCVFVRAHKKGA